MVYNIERIQYTKFQGWKKNVTKKNKQKGLVLVSVHCFRWLWWSRRSRSRRRWCFSWMSSVPVPLHTEVELLRTLRQRGGPRRYCTITLGRVKQHLAQQPVCAESGFLCSQVSSEPLGVPRLKFCPFPVKHLVIHLLRVCCSRITGHSPTGTRSQVCALLYYTDSAKFSLTIEAPRCSVPAKPMPSTV